MNAARKLLSDTANDSYASRDLLDISLNFDELAKGSCMSCWHCTVLA